MKKQLYCDIDSTINNHWVRIQKWALPSFPGNSIDPRAFTEEEILKDEPLSGSLEALIDFSADWDIHYLTARNFPDAYSITKKWLDKEGFPYKTINVVKKSADKPMFLVTRQCDLFIDDLSKGQERGPSYKELYNATIKDLIYHGINFEVFKGDWSHIRGKYL